jgi:AAA15 family ATPase/GTPase
VILEFSVENTYSIKDKQTISFEAVGAGDDEHIINAGNKKLLKLAAIYGANASGKSNIVKAFDFYIRFILDSFTTLKPQEKIPFEPFMFTENPEHSSGFFEIIFCFENIWYKYQIRLNRENVLKEHLASIENNGETTIFNFDIFNNEYEYQEEDEKLLHFVRANAIFLSTAVQFNHTFLGKIYGYLNNVIITAGESTSFDYTSNMLHNEQIRLGDVISLLDKSVIDISGIMFPDKSLVKTEKSDDKYLAGESDNLEKAAEQTFYKEPMFGHKYDRHYFMPFSSESMGTRRFYELTGPLLDCIHNEKNMFIDEIESSFHDDLLDFFVRTFLENTKNSQLLFTTHNQNLLDSDLLRNDEIWFVQRDDGGGSNFFSLAEFNDVPEKVSRRELYKAGAFGALPRTAQFFVE